MRLFRLFRSINQYDIYLYLYPYAMTQTSNQIQKPLLTETSQLNSASDNKSERSVKLDESKIAAASFFSLFIFTTASEKWILFLGTITAIAAGAAFPYFIIFFAGITTLFDDSKRSVAAAQGWELCWKFFILGALTWLTNSVSTYCWNVVGSQQSVRFKKKYYKILLEQEVGWFDENDPHKIATKVATNVTAYETAVGEKMSMMITTMVTVVAAIFLAFFKCWELSVMLLATLPALLIAGMAMMKAMMLNTKREKVSYQAASSRTEQALSQIKTVKGLVGEDYELRRFQTALLEGQKKTINYTFFLGTGIGMVKLVFLLMYSFGLWYGKKILIDNWDSQKYNVGDIITAFFCFIIGGSSIGQIDPFMRNIIDGRMAMAEFFHILRRRKTLLEPKKGVRLETIRNLSLQNVSFSYKADQPVLRKVNVEFPEGQVSALVGESGCGKSTIVQLLLRYYDVGNGEVQVNGHNIKELNMDFFRRKIGFVGQEPVLFAMSIADNLKLANPSLTREDMIVVLKKANAWEFVSKMEQGLDTYVGSGGGAQLSGGQKQRIAIARALCKQPQLLILDEATSALDRKNQRQIQQTLRNLQQNKITTVVIAHRLSTIRDADCIYVMNRGELAEMGTHEELILKEGIYAGLVKTQVAAEGHIQNDDEETHEIQTVQKQQSFIEHSVNKNEVDSSIPKQKLKGVFRKLMGYQKYNKGMLVIGVLGALVSGCVWPFFNYIFSAILPLMLHPIESEEEINRYCLYMLLIAIASGLLTIVYSFAFGMASERLMFRVRIDLFNKLLRLPVSFYDRKDNTAGAISSKLATDVFQIRNMVSGVLGVICLNSSTIISSLLFGMYYSWKVTLIAIALSPLIAVVGQVGSVNLKATMNSASKSQQSEKFLGSLMSDSVCNIRTVKSMGYPQAFLNAFNLILDEINQVNMKQHFKTAVFFGLSKGIIMIVEGLIFFIAAVLFQDNQVADGRAAFTATLCVIFAAIGVGQNSQLMPDLEKSKVAGVGIFDIIEGKGEDELSLQNGGTSQQTLRGDIEFRNVTFKYPQREKIVLQKLCFAIDGQKIALVGHSGSGKSTIVQLLMRFYDPAEGQILINGRDIKQFDLYWLRRQLGLVSQQPALFMGSVGDNIRYNSECEQTAIETAADIAHARRFIEEWEQGFEKEVGQKGAQVSGGQKQRIALCRCLVRQPSIFLFDEFTSALDADTEKAVFESLKPVLSGKTSISVAHRLSTVEDCDRILVFKDGMIIEEGSYAELMQKKQHFYSLAKGK